MTNVIPCRDPLNPPAPGTVAYGLMVTCYKCGERLLWREALADLDGPAFQAYYHPECRPYCTGEGVDAGCSICNPDNY